MSFLFNKRGRAVVKIVWGFVAIVIIFTMILAFSPGMPEFLMGLLG